MVYGLFRALPGERIRLVTVVRGLRFCRTRSGPTCLRELDTSNGCQDHTALPSAKAPIVSRAAKSLTRFISPCDCHCAPGALASTASRPAFVTTRDPPLLSRRDGEGFRSDLGQDGTEIFLQMGLDSPFTDLPVGQVTVVGWVEPFAK